MSRKPRAETTEGRIQIYDQMITMDKICEELTSELSESAKVKFFELKGLRPSNWWTRSYLEDLRILARAHILLLEYQRRECEALNSHDPDLAKKYNNLVMTNFKLVNEYTRALSLRPLQALEARMTLSADAQLRAEKELRKLVPNEDEAKDKKIVNLYAV
jgi:hypothetical protein